MKTVETNSWVQVRSLGIDEKRKKPIGASAKMSLNLVSETLNCPLNMCPGRRVVQPPSTVSIIRNHANTPGRKDPVRVNLSVLPQNTKHRRQLHLKRCLLTLRRVEAPIGRAWLPLLWQFHAQQDAGARRMERCTILPRTQSSSN